MPKKQVWILAGANGVGKTTFYQNFIQATGMPFLNADVLAKKLDNKNPGNVSYDAAILITQLRSALLKTGTSFCFETVFSHHSKIDFVAQAKAHNYEVIVVYIHLENAELNQARIAQRVLQGGHTVPAEKIVSRIPRTMKNIRTALPLADVIQIYDNSYFNTPFKIIAELRNGKYKQRVNKLPEWAKQVLADYISE